MTAGAGLPRPRRSLTFRLIAAATVWMLVLLSAGGIVLTTAFRNSAEQEFGQRLDALLRAMIAAIEVGSDGAVTVTKPLGDPRFEQVFSGWYWQVAEPSGRLVRSRSLWDSTLPRHDDGTEMQRHRIAGPNGESLLAAERDLQFPGGDGPMHVAVAGDLRDINSRVRGFDTVLLAALVLFAFGMVGAIVVQVRFGLQPLRAMTAGLAAIRSGKSTRLEGDYPREVAPLADAMNAVLAHDALLIERARTHVGNLAHGLKTPLAVLKAELHEVPDRKVMDEQVGVMVRLIERHLARAAAATGSGPALGVGTAVRPVVQDIVDVLKRVHAAKGLAFEIDIPATLAFPGDRGDLEEMMGNLIENACKWARGKIRIAAQDADPVVITVEDDGPGIADTAVALALARGIRLDETRAGSGLGLAIVADLVTIYGGTIDLERSPLGGLRAALTLPGRNPR
ncbi:MAG: sensor histidine kinase [Ferrovibrio sp.]|uniref:sensor histidine kinase n=1 Tax=Ferrovibrio sp. TaxID=1917215 RepID=UPI00260FADD7|nr:sensor histidine kinase [Ferrovibrio sp.]MCW0235372.1 sensor histidine kinase [Ferrovibrio sp.]